MSTRIEVDQIETTGGEKVLAVVLAIFVALGAIWAYVRIDDIGRPAAAEVAATPRERAAIDLHMGAESELMAAQNQARAARRQVVFRREAYRTSLDAGQPSAELEQAYVQAQADLSSARSAVTDARTEVLAAKPAANDARERLNAERSANLDGHERQTVLLRILLFVGMLGGSYYALGRVRTRRSRYMPAVYAWIGASAALAIVMVGDYVGDYVEFSETGPLAISVLGTVMTLGAFAGLQRYLARRVPARRVRKGECPFCGFPARGEHCEGCGRTLVAPCARCDRPRRVGADHCAACGKP